MFTISKIFLSSSSIFSAIFELYKVISKRANSFCLATKFPVINVFNFSSFSIKSSGKYSQVSKCFHKSFKLSFELTQFSINWLGSSTKSHSTLNPERLEYLLSESIS